MGKRLHLHTLYSVSILFSLFHPEAHCHTHDRSRWFVSPGLELGGSARSAGHPTPGQEKNFGPVWPSGFKLSFHTWWQTLG